VPTMYCLPTEFRRAAALALKRAAILFGSAIPCCFLMITLLARTALTRREGWPLALFLSAGVVGAILGLAERSLQARVEPTSITPAF
jgi:hypothetical protein